MLSNIEATQKRDWGMVSSFTQCSTWNIFVFYTRVYEMIHNAHYASYGILERWSMFYIEFFEMNRNVNLGLSAVLNLPTCK